MRSNGFLKKIASGVLAAGFLVGIGMAGGSTASAADRRYDNHDQYHSSDFRDGRDRDRRDRDNRFHRGDRDDWHWVRDYHGHWVHVRRSIDWGDGRDHR